MPADRRLRVLITRPAEDAAPLADRLRAEGFDPLIEPLLVIRPTGEALALDGVQAVLLTSANGVRALAAATPRRDPALLAVGDATARAARAAGFGSVESAGGDVADLARLAMRRCAPDRGALLHVSGHDVAGDLAGQLGKAGFAVRRAVLYRAAPAEALSPGLRADLAGNRIDAVVFFSPRTARSFVTLVRDAGLTGACRRMAAFCLSPAVAAVLAADEWRSVRVAAQPEQAALLADLALWAGEMRRIGGAE